MNRRRRGARRAITDQSRRPRRPAIRLWPRRTARRPSLPLDPVQRQARARIRREVLLPIGFVAALIFVGVPALLLVIMASRGPGGDGAVATAANFLLALFILLPMAILCVIPYALLLAAIVGMSIVNRRLPRALQGTRQVIVRVHQTVQRGSVVVARPVIGVSKRLAWLERALGIEPPRAR